MTTREKLDAYITTNHSKMLKYANQIDNKIGDDIYQECVMYIYELPDEKLEAVLPFIDKYLGKMIKYSAQSKTSKYQQKYNKLKLSACDFELKDADVEKFYTEVYGLDDEDFIINSTEITEILDVCSEYDRDIFIEYTSTNTNFKEMSERRNRSVAYIFYKYKFVLDKIKQNIIKNKKQE